jgi:hypothetical protein
MWLDVTRCASTGNTKKNRHMPVFLYATDDASHHRSSGLAGSIAASNVRRQYGQKH